jgi:farnesyl-diphosphate farnesyltransferase
MRPGGQGQIFDASDARSPVAQALDERQRSAWLEKRKQELLSSVKGATNGAAAAEPQETSNTDTLKFVAIAFLIVAAVSLGSVYGIMWILDHI